MDSVMATQHPFAEKGERNNQQRKKNSKPNKKTMNSGKSNDGRREKCGKTSLSSNVRRTHTHSLTRWLGKLMMIELISMMMINDCQRGRVLREADTVSNVITRTFNAHTHTRKFPQTLCYFFICCIKKRTRRKVGKVEHVAGGFRNLL